jgi:hypothetical protein
MDTEATSGVPGVGTDNVLSRSSLLPIRHILRLGSENQWSDLLATLIEIDPATASQAFRIGLGERDLRVYREYSVSPRDRIDLLLKTGDKVRAVVEAKVLSGLSTGQLTRYRRAIPRAGHYYLVTPERLPVGVGKETDWQALSWESVLSHFATSGKTTVAEVARSWLDHLDRSVPWLDVSTVWNAIGGNHDFIVALRGRMSWVFGQLERPPAMNVDLVESAAGPSWVARMYRPARKAGYTAIAEVQEALPVQDFPAAGTLNPKPLLGPSIKVALIQEDVKTSRNFDWDYLLDLWKRYMKPARDDWTTRSANPKAPHDRANWTAMQRKGGPAYLGIGFGENQARKYGSCMFGARFRLPADIQLGAVAKALNDTAQLVNAMAEENPPPSG